MVDRLSQLFSSKARVEVLEVLYYAQVGLGLRKIADLCNMHVRSVEIALRQMQNEKLVKKKRVGNRIHYWLDVQLDNYRLLKEIFQTAEILKIQIRNETFRNEGSEILEFIVTSQKMINKARRSYFEARQAF